MDNEPCCAPTTLVRLGVACAIPRNEYTATRAMEELSKLLNDPTYRVKAGEVARLVGSENGTQTACDAIEKMLSTCGFSN